MQPRSVLERLRFVSEHPTAKQFLRFSIVGCLNVLISSAVFYLCYEHWRPGALLLSGFGTYQSNVLGLLKTTGAESIEGAVASIAAYAAGMINSFLLNKSWTFGIRSGTLAQATRFVVLNAGGAIISTLSMFLFVDILDGPYMTVWIATISVVMALNFVGNKYWTFRTIDSQFEEQSDTREAR